MGSPLLELWRPGLVHVACGLEERGTNLDQNADHLADNFPTWLTASNK
jgi:hypothetical protein